MLTWASLHQRPKEWVIETCTLSGYSSYNLHDGDGVPQIFLQLQESDVGVGGGELDE